MEMLLDQVVAGMLLLLWPMIRISAMLITAPLFSLAVVNLRVRILLGLLLTLTVYPLVDWPFIDPLSAAGLREVFVQVAIGAVMGLILQVVLAAIAVAGQAMSGTMGLMMASMVDPNMGNIPVLSQFLVLLGSLIFVMLGGHLLLVMMLVDSFVSLPVGVMPPLDAIFVAVVSWSSMIFMGAVLIALPVLALLLLLNVSMGVITRAAPALNIFAVGFPALLLFGLLFVLLTLPAMGVRMEALWLDAFLLLRSQLESG